jgi:PAS domain S-box-containing protein
VSGTDSHADLPVGVTEEHFRLLVETVRDYAIFLLDPGGRVATWNEGARRIKGYEASEIVGKHFSVFYPQEDVKSGKCDRELIVAASAGRLEDEGWRVRKDGSRFWANVVITALRDAAGTLVGYAKITRDLTERRHAEDERVRLAALEEAHRVKDELLRREQDARRAAEDAYTALDVTLKSIGDGVITTDEQGLVTMMNPVAEELTGWTAEDARGQPLRSVFAIVNEVTRREVESPVDHVLREGRTVGLANHTVLLRRGGGETAIADSGAPVRGADGKIHGVVLVFRDATAERRDEIHRTFLVEITQVLSSSLDYRETLRRVARIAVPAFADWCGVDLVEPGSPRPVQAAVAHSDPTKAEMAREWASKYPPDPDAPRGAPHVIRTGQAELYPDIPDELLVQSAVDEEHLRILRALHFRSAVIVPITDGNRIRGAMTLVYSESGRSYSEDDLRLLEEVGRRAGVAIENARLFSEAQDARAQADAANRAKDEFLATVSHELRTPLTAILGWARILVTHSVEESKRAKGLDAIERNAIAMAQLVEDLLDVSRIVSGKLRLDVASVDLAPVLRAAIDVVRPAADAKQLRLECDFAKDVGRVRGDAGRLQQVVWNLLSNAVKFTPSGGLVSVKLRPVDASAEITVSDTGKGIPGSFLPHVFDPFRQADGSISRLSGGLGLGLSISRHLVELHGGRIEARSEGEGRGASFALRIPVAPPGAFSPLPARIAESHAPGPGASGAPLLTGARVLVVDDDADARELLQTVLEGRGATVRTAASVDEATQMFERDRPDVLLSDIGMPDKNGVDLIRWLRALPHHQGGDIPAVALTAYARVEERQRVLDAGFDQHVPKPVDPSQLVSVVATLAGSKAPRG